MTTFTNGLWVERAIRKFIEKQFAKNRFLFYVQRHEAVGGYRTIACVYRDEPPFRRYVLLILRMGAGEPRLQCVPYLRKENREINRQWALEPIPPIFIRELCLSEFPPAQNEEGWEKKIAALEAEISAAWENSYRITEPMFNTERALMPIPK